LAEAPILDKSVKKYIPDVVTAIIGLIMFCFDILSFEIHLSFGL